MAVSTHSRLKAAGLPCVSVPAPSKVVSTHSRLKAAGAPILAMLATSNVSTHSRLKAAGLGQDLIKIKHTVSTHSRLKAAGCIGAWRADRKAVSTHSRLKAAGRQPPIPRQAGFGFNTQPPEGGWQLVAGGNAAADCFNTQPPEGGWITKLSPIHGCDVSTHSRLKAAGPTASKFRARLLVSTHSRLKAAGVVDHLAVVPQVFQHTAA